IGSGISIFLPSARLFSETDRSTLSASTFATPSWLFHPSTSKPPPEFPVLYSRPFSGISPVSACSYVARISSPVHRLFPNPSGTPCLRVDPPRPQMMVRPVPCLAFELGLQRHQYCRIYRDQVCTTNDCLGNMFG